MHSLVEETERHLFHSTNRILGQRTTLDPIRMDRETLKIVLDEDATDSFLDTSGRSTGIRKRGEVYTPPSLVRWILDQLGYTGRKDLPESYLVDPACGFGSFLREAVTRLRNALEQQGLEPERRKDAAEIMAKVENHIAGIELSSTTVRRALVSYLEPLREAIQTLVTSNPKYLPRPAVFHSDALSPSLVSVQSFDFVVGNPPYVRNRDLPARIASRQSRTYESATGRFDAYVLFFEVALRWLRNGGRLAFVTPDRFLSSSYGEGLRRLLLAETTIESVFRLPEKIFEGVGIYPIVTIAQRGSPQRADHFIQYREIDSLSEGNSNGSKQGLIETTQPIQVKQSTLGQEAWSFIPAWAEEAIRKLRRSSLPLETVATSMSTGIATGANSVFVLQGSTMDLEPDRLLPVLIAPDVKKGQVEWSGHYILNPYDVTGGGPKPIDLDSYPRTREYLRQHKSLLELKYHALHAKKKWYETHDTVDSRLRNRKKIVTPDISSHNRFAVDYGEFACLNTCNMIFYDESARTEALASILNSNLLEFVFKLGSPRLSRLHYRYMQRYLGKLPVPDIQSLDKREVSYLSSCYRDRDWDSVDKYVFDRYGLSKGVSERVTQSLGNSQRFSND